MTAFAAIGLDHRHLCDHVPHLDAAGARRVGYRPQTSDPKIRFISCAAIARGIRSGADGRRSMP